jgi:hypothetical protein
MFLTKRGEAIIFKEVYFGIALSFRYVSRQIRQEKPKALI